jgi:hypothetical protein
MQTQGVRLNADDKGFAELSAEEVTKIFRKAVKQAVANKQKKDLPVAKYSKKSGRTYLENADGSREYV